MYPACDGGQSITCSFHHVGFRDQDQAIRLDDLYPPRHHVSPYPSNGFKDSQHLMLAGKDPLTCVKDNTQTTEKKDSWL